MVGVVIGLSLSTVSEISQNYTMCYVAGNFIFIASQIWPALLRKTIWYKILDSIGVILGIGVMYLILLAD